MSTTIHVTGMPIIIRRKVTLALLCFSLGLAAGPAWACRPMGQNLVPGYTGEVFLGEALWVREVAADENGKQPQQSYPMGSWSNEGTRANDMKARPLKIRFKVLHWLNPETARSSIEVNGVANSAAGTDCHGVFDFLAKVGEKRLVFGKFREDGSFWPDHFVYVKKEDKGKIPKWLYLAVYPSDN